MSEADSARMPEFDADLAATYVGKYILVGITFLNSDGSTSREEQLHGVIESATPDGILVSLRGAHEGESWNMPPLLSAIRPAEPGSRYILRSSGETVEVAELVATWRVQAPPDGPASGS